MGLTLLWIKPPVQVQARQGAGYTPPQINGQFNADTIYPSQTSRLTINVFNPNTRGLTDIHWTDHLPDDLVIVNPASPLVTGCGSSYILTATPGTQTISLSGATADATSNPASPGICSVTVSVTSFDPINHTNNIDATSAGGKLENYAFIDTTTTAYFEDDAAITLLVLPMDNPSLTKSFTASSITEGGSSLLEIDLKNNDSNVALTQVTLTDTFPTHMALFNTTKTLTNCGSGILTGSSDGGASWHDLAVGDTAIKLSGASVAVTKTCKVLVYVTLDEAGTFTNTIHTSDLTTYQGVTIPSDVSAKLTYQNVTINKAFGYSNFELGGYTTLTITVTNPDSTYSLDNFALTDNLPGGLTFYSGAGTVQSTTCGAGVIDVSDPTKIGLTGGTVPAGGSCEIVVTVTASSSGTYNNTVSCSAGDLSFDKNGAIANPGCNDATASVTIYGSSLGLTATKSFSPVDITPGGYTTLTITIKAPADTAISNLSMTDNLPANVKVYSSPTASLSNCSGTFSPAANDTVLSLTNGSISAGATCTIKVRVTSTEYGDHTNTIATTDIDNAESRHISDDIHATFTVRDISVAKSFASGTIGKNGITTLTIKLTNNFTVRLTDISFTDTLPGTATEGIILASDPAATNTCGGSLTAVGGTQAISLSNGQIVASGSCTITVKVQGVSASTPPPGTTYENKIAIGDVTGKVNGGNATQNWHEATASIKVGSPDFRINKKFDPILVTGSTASTMTVTLVNPGSNTLTNISFTDTLPSHMLLDNPTGAGVGTCGGSISAVAGGGSFTFSGGSLAAGASCKLTINAKMDVTGNLINTISANAVSTDQGATNSQSTSATLTNLSGINVTKSFSPNPASPGVYTILSITLEKVGIGVGLTGLGFTDTLPTNMVVAGGSAPAATSTCGGTLTAVTGSGSIQLSNGAMDISTTTCTIKVSVITTVTTISSYTNCIDAGSVSSNEGYTNITDGCGTLYTLFDPPSGKKVFNSAGLPELEWKMVWINSANTAGIDVQIKDSIPTDTTYITGSIVCDPRGSSTTTRCEYDSTNNQVVWQGNIGADYGATTEDNANNEVVITFKVTIPPGLSSSENQATSTTDTDGDGLFSDETSSASVSTSNLEKWSRIEGGLPETGFAPGRNNPIPQQPADKDYQNLDNLSLEIPDLNISLPVVGVPMTEDGWDLTWLGEKAGWLEYSALPGRDGNSVITGHVVNSEGKPGPFIGLKDLKYGDHIFINAWGQRFEYEVREVKTITPQDIKTVMKHEVYPWITLVTCKDYDEKHQTYDHRTMVRAVLIKIE